jgi:uncharacterized protein YijF (DUF1287 family)
MCRLLVAAIVKHNIGAGTTEEDMLFALPVTGHYRFRIE